jgi:hypothetical protein
MRLGGYLLGMALAAAVGNTSAATAVATVLPSTVRSTFA